MADKGSIQVHVTRDWKRAVWFYGGVFFAYTLLTLVMTYPVVARLDTHLVGVGSDMWMHYWTVLDKADWLQPLAGGGFGGDMWVHYWNGWWIKNVLAEGGSVYSTPLLFYPQMVSLIYHNFGWVNIAGWLLVEPIVGGIAASNLIYLVNVTLCAFAMFILARCLLKSEGPAFVAGLVYGCWPYRLSDYEHPNMISTEWIPLVLLCVILLVQKRGRARYALLAGLFLALTGLSRWQMLLPATIALCVYLLFSVLFERQCWSWRVVRMLALAVFVAVLLIAIPFYPLARDMVTGEASDFFHEEGKGTDLLAYFVPPVNHPLASLFDGLDYVRSPVRFPYSAFLGYTVLAMVMVAVIWRWQAARPWIMLALVAFLLALGPVLRFDGRLYPAVPMPYQLVGWLTPLRLMRDYHRFNALLALPLAVLAGYGAAVLRDWLARRRPIWLWGVLSALILFDYFNLPAATTLAHVPDFYYTLAKEPGDFAIVELPGDRQHTEYYMFYQTVHGRPLLTGHVSRLPPQATEFISSVPLVDDIYESGMIDTQLPDLSRQLLLLSNAGFRYIILHKNMASPGQLSKWRSYLAASPRYEDDEVVVYSTAPVVGQDCLLRYDLGSGMGLIDANLSTETIHPDAVLELQVIWGTTVPPVMNLQVEVALVDEEGNVGQERRFGISPDWPTGEWSANAIARDGYSFRIEPWLGSGAYSVIVGLVMEENGQPVGQRVKVGKVVMLAPERSFAMPPMAQRAGATFDDALHLLGYDLEVEADAIHITLHWRALRRMEARYKFFVHLYDPESKALAAQADVMSHNWTYPTTWWEAGEIVSDEIVLSLEGVPEGRYQLGVGVYHSGTGVRLPVVEIPMGLDVDDERLLLPGVIER